MIFFAPANCYKQAFFIVFVLMANFNQQAKCKYEDWFGYLVKERFVCRMFNFCLTHMIGYQYPNNWADVGARQLSSFYDSHTNLEQLGNGMTVWYL